MSKKKDKKKKEKITYIDDGSTVADMTLVTRTGKPRQKPTTPPPTTSKVKTFFTAMGRMVLPMCIVLLVLAVISLILLAIGGNL